MDREQALNIRYEEIIRSAVEEWRSVWLSLDNLEAGEPTEKSVSDLVRRRMDAVFIRSLEEFAVRRLQTMNDGEAEKIADAMIDRWLKRGDLNISEPSESVRRAIESALEKFDERPTVFYAAARQKAVKALALREAKVPLAQIAKVLGVSKSTASSWIAEEEQELEELKKTLSIYGYKAVKD
jgi:Fic family protein